jgi:hypothetical protein
MGYISLVKCLSYILKALGSILSTIRKKEERKRIRKGDILELHSQRKNGLMSLPFHIKPELYQLKISLVTLATHILHVWKTIQPVVE